MNYGIDIEAARRSREHSTKQLKKSRVEFVLSRMARLKRKLKGIPNQEFKQRFGIIRRVCSDRDELLGWHIEDVREIETNLKSKGELPFDFDFAV